MKVTIVTAKMSTSMKTKRSLKFQSDKKGSVKICNCEKNETGNFSWDLTLAGTLIGNSS